MPPTQSGSEAASLEDAAYAAANATSRGRFSVAYIDFAHGLRWYAQNKREEKPLDYQISLIMDCLESLDALLVSTTTAPESRELFEEQHRDGQRIITSYRTTGVFDEIAIRRYANRTAIDILGKITVEESGPYRIVDIDADRPTPGQ